MELNRRTLLESLLLAAASSLPLGAAEGRAIQRGAILRAAKACWREIGAPSLVFGAIKLGRPPVKGAFGTRRLGKSLPVSSKTLYHMASVTKPFVATAIMQLVDEGKLRLSDKIYDVLPEFRIKDKRTADITIEQMMTHRSGLPDVEDYDWAHPETDPGALARYIKGMSGMSLLFAPATGLAYSNIAYEILARVIEVLDRDAFETAMKRRILAPLGMRRSTLFYPEADKQLLATPHLPDAQGAVRAINVFPYNRRHAGSSTLISCVDDMLLWVQANLQDGMVNGTRIMSASTARALRSPRPGAGEDKMPMGLRSGLGWFIIPHPKGDIILHPGQDEGFISICAFSPSTRSGVVAMANRSGPAEDRLASFGLSVLEMLAA